ncbi:hypothetical protein BJX61DRAFT_357773 [Aspergillus egyptiacus]|nr:hypothetical protein BJX61DRAFT_357773 [Aspergillus egyptiacus]
MPPLSAYTPLESLLFFQSLAASGTRPTSFVSISDLLCSNKFVRENGAFDVHRLSPESLEDLYTTLMRDGLDSSDAISTREPNGHHPDSISPNNPKKRKISSPRPDGLADGANGHSGFVPGLVSHLYARYKDLVTKEIRSEEKRFKEIRDEIEQLQKEEREAPAENIAKPAPMSVTHAEPKPAPAPEPMDLDTKETPVEKPQSPKELKPGPIEPAASVETKQPQLEIPRKDQPPPPAQISPQPAVSEVQSPARPLGLPETETNNRQQIQQQAPALPKQPQSQPPIPVQQSQPQLQLQPRSPVHGQHGQPAVPNLPPRSQLPNGKAPSPLQQARPISWNPPVQDKAANVPSAQPQKPLPAPVALAPAPAPAPTPTKAPVGTPLPTPQIANVPAPSATPQKAASGAKAAGKKAPVSTGPPRVPPPSSFQQWSLNQPQTPQPPSFSVPEPAAQPKPLQPPPTQQTPKPEPRVRNVPQPMAAPSTPQPNTPVFHTPAPAVSASTFATPVGPVQSFPSTVPRASRPRLSLHTPGSLTPWKQTPHLTLAHSPRSPERPRPEDVSPISEKAQSPFESREATPEEREPPPRKKGPGRGRKKATDGDQTGPKKKGEKPTWSAGKKRDRSASSRSRGLSIVSRDEESEFEPGKIKREVPNTPARLVDSTELERVSEPRPRGRPKRKRAPSEAAEPEASQPELNQLKNIDPNQSTPFVLCARNFARTGAPIMNDVTMHKHASIFTKPLTERDAPGYRDLIYRPQDLKSIKSAIHQGSKALATATEAASTPVADGESPAPNSATPSKNAVLMIPKTEDVIPPKAIVTSAQLEKELIRMFANAVMFNPVPQRGFGPAFPMSADGVLGRRSYAPEPDEGGIIKDTLEMFEDVEQAVTRWRAAERTVDDLASKGVLSLRRGSASDPNMESGADDGKS